MNPPYGRDVIRWMKKAYEAIAFLEKSTNPGDRVYRECDNLRNARMLYNENGLVVSKIAYEDTDPDEIQAHEIEDWDLYTEANYLPPDNWYIVRASRFKKGEIVFRIDHKRLYFYESENSKELGKWSFIKEAQDHELLKQH